MQYCTTTVLYRFTLGQLTMGIPSSLRSSSVMCNSVGMSICTQKECRDYIPYVTNVKYCSTGAQGPCHSWHAKTLCPSLKKAFSFVPILKNGLSVVSIFDTDSVGMPTKRATRVSLGWEGSQAHTSVVHRVSGRALTLQSLYNRTWPDPGRVGSAPNRVGTPSLPVALQQSTRCRPCYYLLCLEGRLVLGQSQG